MPAKSKVYFFFDNTSINFPNRTQLKKSITLLFKKEKKILNRLNYIFCTDKKLLEINRQYLNHDFYTDVITFDLSETDNRIIGEIYISIDRVKENAGNLGISIRSELQRIVFHGALHLCGYNDKSKEDKLKMRKREEYYLSKYLL